MHEPSTLEFFSKLRDLNVMLTADGDRLGFNAPPGVMTPDLRNELRARKADLLKLLRDAPLESHLSRIQSAPRDRNLPLSFAQQRLWFLAQMDGVSETYHMPLGLRFKGRLDRLAIRGALDRIVARHEALRTTFSVIGGDPVQRIASSDESHFPLIEHDLRQEKNAKAELDSLIELEVGAPFDLEAGPMIRGRLIRLGDDEYVLLITMHHIASDGWSVRLLCNELSALYAAFLRGQGDPLPELDIQYADYSVWHRQWVGSDQIKQQASYWKAALAGAPARLELPTDHPRPAVQDYKGAHEELALGEELTTRLREFSRRHRVTLFMTLAAVWAALLSRLSGQQEVVIGTPVANRGTKEIEGLIGFFVNTVALRIDLSGSPTVSQLLERTRVCSLAALQHQDLPFERVVDLIRPARNLAYSPVFQVMFGWQESAQEPVELPDLETQLLSLPHRKAKFDLTVLLQDQGDTVTGFVEYATSLFEQATIKRYLQYFRTLLQGIMDDDTQIVDRLPILSEAERNRVLYEWNDTRAEFATDECLHELFEKQAAKTPDAVAVVFKGQGMTYRELNRRANQVAQYLRSLGVGPDVLVGLFVERSPRLLVGLLGILKAGGAYVPLDPNYPKVRIGHILEDSRISVILTQESLARELPNFTGHRVCLDKDWAQIASESEEAPVTGVNIENLAYVLFTSGSTGRPKGVAVSHRPAVNFVRWSEKIFTPEETAGILFSTSICFDMSVFEIFVALNAGGKLILVPNVFGLSDLPEDGGVTLINTVPSALAELLRTGAIPASVKSINLAGEALSEALVKKIYANSNPCTVYNHYGPTETFYSTYAPVLPGRLVTIGKPISNLQCYILDANRNPVPVGVPGELFIGGSGLALGYYDRAGLTDERFVPNPFAVASGARMYRTGDLARWLADGNIEYLGRNDFQVKIRGFRVELGEIEASLAKLPGVSEVVVIAREDTSGDKQLVAYYTTAGDQNAAGAEQFRQQLSANLPDYMLPAAYVLLESFPLTPNGKLDRKALPAPEMNSISEQDYEAPIGPIETTLASIWSDVLKLDRVGRRDNFFALGGDSIMSFRVVTQAEREGIKLNVTAMIADQTIAGLASVVQAANRAKGRYGISGSAVMPQSSETTDLENRVEIEI